MRHFLTIILLVFFFIPSAMCESIKTLYTCGMHPQVILDHPGNCPICGMKLTPIHKQSGVTSKINPTTIEVDAATLQKMNLRTEKVQVGPLRKTIRTVGFVDYNETALADVTLKFKGWVEKLNANATGQLVHRGESMFEVYSPELYSAEVEYLQVLNSNTNAPNFLALKEAAAGKLRFFDISEAQITELEHTRMALKTLPIVAPVSGFIIEKNVVQGQMVDAGMRLYRVADLDTVWVIAQVYEQDIPFLKLKQEAVVKAASLPGREFRGKIAYIYPTLDEKTRTVKVRLEFENKGYFLKPGLFVSMKIHSSLNDSAVLVSDSAILRSGTKNTVFIALDDGRFEARTVELGVQAENGMNQVVRGVSAGERIVTSGQFLLDSESQLREAIEKMKGSTFSVASNEMAIPTNKASAKQLYTCPMDPDVLSDKPGKCPKCEMDLVPVKSK